MNILGIILGLGLLAFLVYQLVGLIKDVKENRQKKKESVQEKEKTE